MSDFFKGLSQVKYEGPESRNALAYRHYNKDEVIAGKRMEDHIRPAIAYWHTLAQEGGDPFGGRTFDRPWFDKGLDGAKLKAEVAFEFFNLIDVPFFAFHDVDVAPEGATLEESNKNLRVIGDIIGQKMQESGKKLLWGTANLFSNRRYMAGAATNPDPEVFAYAAGQVKAVLELTHELGGENYVLWGGREGYETLLNTKIGQEQDQMARFLTLVIEHAEKIGFKGQILIEPKPQEPSKHQYDYDVATVFGFLQKYGLEKKVKCNIEVGHAFLAGHSFCSPAGTPTTSPIMPAKWRSPSTTSSSKVVSARAASTLTPRYAASRSTPPTCCMAISWASTRWPAASRAPWR